MNEIGERLKFIKEKGKLLTNNLVEFVGFLPDPTFIINTDGKILAWNHAIEKLTNKKAKNMLGKGNYEYTLAIFGKRRPMLIDIALKSREIIERNYSFFLKDKDNNTLSVEGYVKDIKVKGAYLWAKARPLYNSKKEIVGAIQIIHDITARKLIEQELKESEKKLKKRVKELQCLYGIIKLINNPNISIDEILKGTLELIPPSLQFPEIACVRFFFDEKEYKTSNYSDTPWKISNKIIIKNKEFIIDIHYLKKRVILKEEEELLEEICQQLKAIFEFKLIWIQ